MARTSVQGATVLVTGASRGIGAAAAERLHARGANVVLVGMEPELLGALAARLGERALAFEADVTDTARMEEAVEAAVERFGGVDVAIANAGVHWTGAFGVVPLSQIEREIEINLLGVIRTTHAVLPQIKERRGYLLNIASLAAASHAPLMTAYAAAKAGVEGFTNSLRIELASTGARAGCAYFGVIDTDMVRDAYAHPAIDAIRPLMPGFIAKPIPVSRAVDAIERGVAGRRARVWAPRYVGPALLLRGVLQPLTERHAMRSSLVADALPLTEEIPERHERIGV